MKRILKIIGISLLVVIILLVSAPFLFKGKLENLLRQTINNRLTAEVAWQDLDLSLFRSFPEATLVLKDFTVINRQAPYTGDTLAKGSALQLDLGIKQLFKTSEDEPIALDAIRIDDAVVWIKIDSSGATNYDIVKETPASETPSANSGFTFDIAHYELNNANVTYEDRSNNTRFQLHDFNHEGNGDFSADVADLDTQTEGLVSLDYDGINYLNKNKLALEAVIELNFPDQKYTFKENEARINQLPLVFEGFVQNIPEGTLMDLSFETPSSDFKNFLAILPEVYLKNLDGVETTGDFRVSGRIEGEATETTIPRLDIAIASDNASFNYPSLPKRVDNITIDALLKNETGIASDTYLLINALNFRIDDNTMRAQGSLRNLTENIAVALKLKGVLDLADIEKVYPLDKELNLNGLLKADVSTRFTSNAIEQQRYQDIASTGSLNLNNFSYAATNLPNPIKISQAQVNFSPGNIKLSQLEGSSGSTDFKATGTIQNLIPFLMSREDLKGQFDLQSNRFDLNDFKSPTIADEPSTDGKAVAKEAITIPDFLDARLNFRLNQLVYDNITLRNATGAITIAEETASLKEVRSDLFGGTIALDGQVSTKGTQPTFNMALNLNSLDIDQSFKGLDMLRQLAPVAKALQGVLSTQLSVSGNLDQDLSPVLSSIAGNALAELLTAEVNTAEMPLLSLLDSKLDFVDLTGINLDGLKTKLDFQDGLVTVRPFDFDVKGIGVKVSGNHSLQNQMDYRLQLDVPARYLGKEASQLLAKLSGDEMQNTTVALPVQLTGNFGSPQVTVNTQAAITELSQRIVQRQKDNLKQQGKDKVNEVLGGLLGRDTIPTPATDSSSTTTPQPTTDKVVKDAAKDILSGLLGRKKKTADTTKTNNEP
ncbi:AsmA family protein [Croceiramulus getboli]|nr:AsmA-like C-terminal region-containing protein [Flavobacteriaceae bacterium YJPT1-3]